MESEHKLQETKLSPVLMTKLHEEHDILPFEFIIINISIIVSIEFYYQLVKLKEINK